MKKFLIIIILLAIIFVWWWWYLGGFSKLTVEEKEMGPYTVVYVDNVGDYKKVGPVMDNLYQWLKKAGITQTAGIWIYLDNPASVPVDQLRSQVWSVINPEDEIKITDLWLSYKTQTIEKKLRLVVAFPYKNMLSYFMGPIKVYPVLNKYISEKWYATWSAAIELYDQTNKMIYFMMDK